MVAEQRIMAIYKAGLLQCQIAERTHPEIAFQVTVYLQVQLVDKASKWMVLIGKFVITWSRRGRSAPHFGV